MKRSILATLWCGVLLSAATSFATDRPLSLSVAPQVSGGNLIYEEMRSRSLAEWQMHFHVVLTNPSDKAVRFWREECSWGYNALSFKLTDENGKIWIARKKPAAFTMNPPAYWELAPKQSLAIDVYFADLKLWEGFPPPPAHGTLQAICEIQPDEQSQKLGVWTGHLVSDRVPYDYRAVHIPD